jgi:hypothetical protein
VSGDQPRQTGSLGFTTREPGAPTGAEYDLRFFNPADPNAKPHAVRELEFRFHRGTVIDTSVVPTCDASDPELMLSGAEACRSDSRVGTGSIVVDSGFPDLPGAFPRFVENDAVTFNIRDGSLLYSESTNTPGAPIRTVTRTRNSGEPKPHVITSGVPFFPGAPPPDPYLALKRFVLRVDRIANNGGAYLRTPPTCPSSGYWTNQITFRYQDGVSQTTSTQAPCAQEARNRTRPPCFRAPSTVRGNRLGRAGLARRRRSVRTLFAGDRGRYREWVDRYCLRDGSTVRIGYPTHRERKRLSRSERRRIGHESIFVLTTSRSLRIRGVGRGMGVRALHRRIGGGNRVRVGKNLWYFRKGRNSRHVFKVQRGRVLEMGIADARLTKGRARAKRFFRQNR